MPFLSVKGAIIKPIKAKFNSILITYRGCNHHLSIKIALVAAKVATYTPFELPLSIRFLLIVHLHPLLIILLA